MDEPTPGRKVAVLYAVTMLVLITTVSGGYYVTGLFTDEETAVVQFTVSGAGNSAGNAPVATPAPPPGTTTLPTPTSGPETAHAPVHSSRPPLVAPVASAPN